MTTYSPSTTRSDLYARDGYLIERELFSPQDMETLKACCAQAVGPGATHSGVTVFSPPAMSGDNQLMKDVATDPRLLAVLHEVIGPHIEFLSAKPVFKSAATTFASPWHQDWSYWGGSTKVSVWIALDDATVANGCLKVVPGSHTTVLTHDKGEQGRFDNRIEDEHIDQTTVMPVELKAGDALIFHDLLLHASYANTSGKDRWSYIPTYRNADEVDSSSSWSDPIRLSK